MRGEIDLVHLDLRELSGTLSRAADAWKRGEHVELDGRQMIDATEQAVALLLSNHMDALLRGLAAKAARCDTLLAGSGRATRAAGRTRSWTSFRIYATRAARSARSTGP